MIKEFVKAWDANKKTLRNYIASHDQEEYNEYSKIVLMMWIVLACFVGFLNATIMMIVCILLVAVLFAWIKFAVSCFEED